MTVDKWTTDWLVEDAKRISTNGSYAEDLARVKALADPETMRLHRELSESSETRPIEDDGVPLVSLDSLFSHSGWPLIRRDAFQGPLGQFALAAAPFTEADPIAILVQCLVGFGVAVNKSAYMLAGNDRHPAALNAAIVGETAKAGKGTSKSAAFGLMSMVDPALMASQLRAGFGSGEALIDALAGKKDDEPEARDTRLWVVESELARAMRVIGREGSTLGSVVRMMWDGSKLEARSRTGGIVVAEQYHAGIVGHITTEELRSVLTAIEIYGGTANRFLWACARRTQRLPDGGNIPAEVFERYAEPLKRNLRHAYHLGRMHRTSEANLLWHLIYDSMGDDEPGGLLGAVTARAEPQVLRLSLAYALADGAKEIGIEHVGAAWALWRYCRGSAERIFGDATGNEPADRLLKAIRGAGDGGLDSKQQMAVFSNHLKATQLASIRADLERRGLLKTTTEETSGRPRVLSVSCEKSESSDA